MIIEYSDEPRKGEPFSRSWVLGELGVGNIENVVAAIKQGRFPEELYEDEGILSALRKCIEQMGDQRPKREEILEFLRIKFKI